MVADEVPEEASDWQPRKLNFRERLVDFIARLHRTPPRCGVCGIRMRWMDGAWDCPNLLREDHRVELEDGGILYTTERRRPGGEDGG